MAKEKFIRGKKDNCNHDGLYSIRKREQAADFELAEYYRGVEMEEGIEYNLPSMRNSANEIVRNKSPWQQPQPQNNPNI